MTERIRLFIEQARIDFEKLCKENNAFTKLMFIDPDDLITTKNPKTLTFHYDPFNQPTDPAGKKFINKEDADEIFKDWDYIKNRQPKKCECGIAKVYGDKCPGQRHSDWCPLYEPKDK